MGIASRFGRGTGKEREFAPGAFAHAPPAWTIAYVITIFMRIDAERTFVLGKGSG